MPWSKYRSIEKRFLDLRFTGVENALNHYARCEEGDRDKQYVFDGTYLLLSFFLMSFTLSKSSSCTIIQKPFLFFWHNAITGILFSAFASFFVSSYNVIT